MLLCLAQFMLVLDVTVMNVALPQVSAELGLDGRSAAWAIAAYAIAFGGLLLLGGRLADLVGSRRMVLTGLAVFTGASLAAGLADSTAALLAARGVQGAGAALLSPAALSAVVQLFTGPARARALAVWGGVGASGAAVGVLLGGLLVGGPGWRWIFYVNVPVGLLVAAGLPLVVPALRAPANGQRRGRVDVAGAVLATLGMAALVAAIGTDVAPGLAWAAAAVAVAARSRASSSCSSRPRSSSASSSSCRSGCRWASAGPPPARGSRSCRSHWAPSSGRAWPAGRSRGSARAPSCPPPSSSPAPGSRSPRSTRPRSRCWSPPSRRSPSARARRS
jgi:MFS family permease